MIDDYDKVLVENQNDLDSIRELIDDFLKIKLIFVNKNKSTELVNEYLLTLNLIGFLITSKIDIVIIFKYLSKKNLTNAESNYFNKKGYLVIYEVLNTYNKLNQFLKITSKIYPELKNHHNKITFEVSKFKLLVNFDGYIKDIRNTVSGHFNSSFMIHYDTLNELHNEQSKFHFLMFMDLINEIRNYVNELEKQQELVLKDLQTLKNKYK
ncbi:hypothetical protein [Flavobacterium capsici]|uniref:Uncharacterized protein n=1 Tax=Flavobacterium capsici TaxID=3075618 RepID=A0AA96J5T4_9FLAO|nr:MULTISPECIES: hypothetical protein [unclassified Flavobacterium]WNM18599.1 hypothetical protein RN608_11335 [Flavobacterium sp. PMR2A8]WNM22650.1 hypothetical protein RN605_04635 [Flavobacterium sp. PMTSA4]